LVPISNTGPSSKVIDYEVLQRYWLVLFLLSF